MRSQILSAFMRKSVMFRLGLLAGLIGVLVGCGSGGGSSSTAGSEVIPEPVNQNPTAAISSPSGTSFNEGENIVFSGTASDAEDSQLNENNIVWTSSLDGIIGNGSTLITSALSSGDHDITLSATDSNGATYTTGPVIISVEPTRFIKMGFQTSGVVDAFYAFDGDHNTAATVTTDETAIIHLKAFIGAVDTFHFRVKLGASTLGSILNIEGLDIGGNWQAVSDIDLSDAKIATIKVAEAQTYKDAEGYINLRATLINEQSLDSIPVYEFWRDDPVYAGTQTTGVTNPDLAFDGDLSTHATIINPSSSLESLNYLHFKTYVSIGESNAFSFNILLNEVGLGQYLVIEAENVSTKNWEFVEDLNLNTNKAINVSIQESQNYVDVDGYISLRVYWVGIKDPGNSVEIFEIQRIDTFFVGSKTSSEPFTIEAPENAVDNDLNSSAIIYYFWGESDHKDFLHVQTYVGDASFIKFSIAAAISALPEAELIIDGEYGQDNWFFLESITIDDFITEIIELPNIRDYVDANGYLSLRLRFNSDSIIHDAIIYEIWR